MKINPKFAHGGILFVALGTAGPAAAQASANSPGAKFFNRLLTSGPRWASVDTFDVAGVRLGMTPQQTRTALKDAGFTPRATDPTQDSWASMVSRRAAERIGGRVDETKVPMLTRASGPQGETVEIWYAATEEGARATSIEYMVPTKRMERATFAAGLSAKYGRPTVRDAARDLYCTKGEGSCVAYQNKALPYLLAESGYEVHSVRLAEGVGYAEEMKGRMAAAVEAEAPRKAKASF